MLIADYIISLSLVLFSILVGFSSVNRRSALLAAISGLGLGTCNLAIAYSRSVAIFSLILAFAFFVASIVALRRARPPRRRPIAGITLLLLSLIAITPLLAIAPSIRVPNLAGPYSVGVRSAEVVDHARGNAWNTFDDGPRRLPIRVWYPSAAAREDAHRFRNTPEERRLARAVTFSRVDPAKLFRETLVRSDMNAAWDVEPLSGKFPLLVFSHGYLGSIVENAILMEQLASYGYVVASTAHPGESSNLTDMNGETIPVHPQATEVMAEIATSDIWDAFHRDYAKRLDWTLATTINTRGVKNRFPLWVADMRVVAEAFESPQLEQSLGNVVSITDARRIGYFGMSAGAAAAPLACHDDPRCAGAVALDVLAGLEPLRNKSTNTPVLVFDSTVPSRMGGQDLFYEPYDSHGHDPHVYRVEFHENGHLDFTDTTLSLTPFGKWFVPKFLPLLGTTDATETLSVQVELVRTFFDRYVKEQESAGFPDGILDATRVANKVDPEPFREWVESRTGRDQ